MSANQPDGPGENRFSSVTLQPDESRREAFEEKDECAGSLAGALQEGMVMLASTLEPWLNILAASEAYEKQLMSEVLVLHEEIKQVNAELEKKTQSIVVFVEKMNMVTGGDESILNTVVKYAS